jgi:hypothetical protein
MPEMAEARRLLDEAVARTVAQRTAWVGQFVRADRDAPRADDLRLEGAVDLRRRVAVVAETGEDPAPPRRFETDRSAPAGRLLEPFGRRRPVVYAGGSRYVATAAGWEHEAGEISAPRRPSDPVWLLDALGHATACVAEDGAVTCRLDAGGAHDVDWSGLLPAGRRWGMLSGPGGRRRRDALAHVPCVVAIGDDGAIARMSFAGPGGGAGLRWTTTEFVDYRVPVEIPDLMARVPAAV